MNIGDKVATTKGIYAHADDGKITKVGEKTSTVYFTKSYMQGAYGHLAEVENCDLVIIEEVEH